MDKDLTVYQELAELKLENRLITERLTSMTRLAVSYGEERMKLVQQLYDHGLCVNGQGKVVRLSK